MKHLITGVEHSSVAEAHGIAAGDTLLMMNGRPVIDEIDYQAFSVQPGLTLTLARQDGREETLSIHKEEWEPLGIKFGESMTLTPRTCHNKCVFCFVDQMRPGTRPTLHVKDDDWRYSLMMGNFVTLTNVSDDEFARIMERRASPLYVSVHTTDPQLRCRMMNNRLAGGIMERLTKLKEAGIRFHCQIVCCPGLNDGQTLMDTLYDLRSLAPATLSVAVVPVGLTKFRAKLAPLTLFNSASAKELLAMVAPFQKECREQIGTSLVFPSDEFYCLSGEPIPPYDWYEGFPQIENGVGLLAQLEDGMRQAAQDDAGDGKPLAKDAETHTYVLISGTSATPHMERLTRRFTPAGTQVHVVTIVNHFFGETITVTGLLTGEDTLSQIPPETLIGAETVLISCNMLRHERDLFLDDMTLTEFESRLPVPVRIVDDGYDLYEAIHGR